ncbi:glycosyl hydrolase [Rhodoferax lacus]|uniref:Glycosyl hydrolase n=2 Tax=Rhodoferax lacus TaxID=2184758 RepID=A0A3E1RAQ2_9BURK|nr:glycosyl hydrolase [Rhodoferax lacus]
MAALMAAAAVQAFAPRETPALAVTRLAVEKLHLNTIARSKAGLVTAGELGTVLYSTNQGRDWQRAAMPVQRQALINQISFAGDGLTGMAVGHEGWILRTTDGGLSWEEVAFDEQNGEPLMGVGRLPSGSWIVVGAFGRALRSDDAGNSWQRLVLPKTGDALDDKHMNRVVGSADGRHWLIVGERGLVLRSDDGGEHWAAVEPFYKGSLYNAAALPDGNWLAYGMRGNAFVSQGAQGSWSRSTLPVPTSFFNHAVLPDGRLLLVGQGSLIATSTDGGNSFGISRAKGRATLTDIQVAADGSGWITSDAGLQALPQAQSAQPPADTGAKP